MGEHDIKAAETAGGELYGVSQDDAEVTSDYGALYEKALNAYAVSEINRHRPKDAALLLKLMELNRDSDVEGICEKIAQLKAVYGYLFYEQCAVSGGLSAGDFAASEGGFSMNEFLRK